MNELESVVWGLRYFEGKPVLTATVGGVLHYEAASFCRITEHKNATDAVMTHVAEHQRRKLNVSAAQSTIAASAGGATWANVGPNPFRWFITREGANRLVLDSVVPGAVRIKQWLADEVWPAIEETGSYVAPGASLPLLPDFSALGGEALEFLGKLGQALTATSQALAIEQARNADQAKELEVARPKAEFVDTFVHVNDTTVFRKFAEQINHPEQALRKYLMARKVIYRTIVGYRGKKRTPEYEYHAYADYKTWFHSKDQPEAPRLPGGRMRTTLYVTALGKVKIADLLKRRPLHLVIEEEAS